MLKPPLNIDGVAVRSCTYIPSTADKAVLSLLNTASDVISWLDGLMETNFLQPQIEKATHSPKSIFSLNFISNVLKGELEAGRKRL